MFYKIMSICLMYPSGEQQSFCQNFAKQHQGEDSCNTCPVKGQILPLIKHLAKEPLAKLQEDYVQTFDMNAKNSLYLFEHIHGDDKERGQALVNLKEEYEKHGFTMEDELPDYIPAFLEFLSTLDADEAQDLLDATVNVLALLEERLRQAESPYAAVFAVLLSKATVQPEKIQPEKESSEPSENQGQDNVYTSCSCY